MSFNSAYHAPVLASEVVELLRRGRRVLDGTLGGGGHSLALLGAGGETVGGGARGGAAAAAAGARRHEFTEAGRFFAVQSNYARIDEQPALDGMSFDGI